MPIGFVSVFFKQYALLKRSWRNLNCLGVNYPAREVHIWFYLHAALKLSFHFFILSNRFISGSIVTI